MENRTGYVVFWCIDDCHRYTIWIDGVTERDYFVKIPGTSNLLISRTQAGLKRMAEQYEITINKQAAHKIDMNRAFAFLKMLRPNKFLSKRAAKILLAAWNGLDDVAYSIGDTDFERNSRMEHNQKLYERIFFANELPSITPPGKHFRIILSDKERKNIRNLLKKQGSRLLEKSGIIDHQ